MGRGLVIVVIGSDAAGCCLALARENAGKIDRSKKRKNECNRFEGLSLW